MSQTAVNPPAKPSSRPWFREPWVWLLIALPAAAVIGCAITIWLALSRPDYLVVDKQQYQQLESGFRAGEAGSATTADGLDQAAADQKNGDG